MSIPTLLIGGLKSAFLTILGAVLTKEMFIWLIMESLEIVVRKTKNTDDDKFFAKIKEAVEQRKADEAGH